MIDRERLIESTIQSVKNEILLQIMVDHLVLEEIEKVFARRGVQMK